MLKLASLAIAIAALGGVAKAETYSPAGHMNNTAVFVDVSGIQDSGRTKLARMIVVFSPFARGGNTAAYSVSDVELSCKERRLRYLKVSFYLEDDRLNTTSSQPEEWRTIFAGSLLDRAARVVCSSSRRSGEIVEADSIAALALIQRAKFKRAEGPED